MDDFATRPDPHTVAFVRILQDKAEGKVPPAFWDVWWQYNGVYDKRYS